MAKVTLNDFTSPISSGSITSLNSNNANFGADVRDVLFLTAGQTVEVFFYTTQSTTIQNGANASKFVITELTR